MKSNLNIKQSACTACRTVDRWCDCLRRFFWMTHRIDFLKWPKPISRQPVSVCSCEFWFKHEKLWKLIILKTDTPFTVTGGLLIQPAPLWTEFLLNQWILVEKLSERGCVWKSAFLQVNTDKMIILIASPVINKVIYCLRILL